MCECSTSDACLTLMTVMMVMSVVQNVGTNAQVYIITPTRPSLNTLYLYNYFLQIMEKEERDCSL